ncbi:MAG: hypothetical protein JWQ27_143 [Ferruginibacter sp.]|nr:hypothetical protein [Ferruginibacter sp.]
MMFEEIKAKYQAGKINKWEYIDEMYKVHDVLFEYGQLINATNISRIEIIDNEVLMTFRDSGVKFICIQGDKRLAPFDTLNFGSYEIDELTTQQKLIGERDVIFDIGANLGWYALHMAKEFPKASVHSFEPFANTFDYLNKNISLNHLSNIVTYNLGFSDTAGMHNFYVDPKLSVNASLVNVAETASVNEVACLFETMDSFCEANNKFPDFIKCDVEGAELLVFRGGQKTLQNRLPIVFTEMLRKWTAKFNYHPNDIIELFVSYGYQCFTMGDEGLRMIGKIDEHTIETNFVFLHAEKHADKINLFLHK